MKYFIFVLLSFGLLINSVEANENDPLIELLVVAKTTGMCGTIKQLSAFQEATKMPGGDNFLIRFVNTEAARLGKTLPELLTECKASVAIYTKTMESLGFE